jgi:hypothetical protein
VGTLVAMRYPTALALGVADHTYVKCANDGKAWGCWGGKTGGTELRRGDGSTNRADSIAGHDEKAGIKCYLVNGVCHQSANRIILPASITVRGARGYGVSEVRFGTYGRPRGRGIFRNCVAPFNQYPGVTGDLPECVVAMPAMPIASGAAESLPSPQYSSDGEYLRRVLEVYRQPITDPNLGIDFDRSELVKFMVTLFDLKLDYNLGGSLDDQTRGRLRNLREELENAQIDIEEDLVQMKIQPREYVEKSDQLTMAFQEESAQLLQPDQYTAFFDLEPGEFVKLADPAIAEQVFGR